MSNKAVFVQNVPSRRYGEIQVMQGTEGRVWLSQEDKMLRSGREDVVGLTIDEVPYLIAVLQRLVEEHKNG